MADRRARRTIARKARRQSDDTSESEEPTQTSTAAASAAEATLTKETVARFIDTFEDRVYVERPLKDTSKVTVPESSSTGETGGSESTAPTAQFDDAAGMSPVHVEVIAAVPAQSEETEDIHTTAAREFLESTGRWPNAWEMTHEELNAAVSNESRRALLAIEHEVPQTDEQLDTYAGVVTDANEAEQVQQAKDQLVASGEFTQEEVDAMDPADVMIALEVVQRTADNKGWGDSAVRVSDDGLTESVITGGSIGLRNRQVGTGSDDDNAGEGAAPSGQGTQPGSDSNQSDDDNDDDDNDDSDDDDDDDQDEPPADEASTDQEEESEDAGEGTATAETTPTPDDPGRIDPAALAAFLESPLGRETMRGVEGAVEMGVGGGLVDPPADDDAGREQWLGSRLSTSDTANVQRAVDVAITGGHTDPTEEEPPTGISAVDEVAVAGGGAIDPVEDPPAPAPTDSPLFPGGGVPSSPTQELLDELMANTSLLEGRLQDLASSLDASQLGDELQEFDT